MSEKKTLTAVIELVTVALAIYAQERTSKAEWYFTAMRASRWAAERFGRIAMEAEKKYHEEVGP